MRSAVAVRRGMIIKAEVNKENLVAEDCCQGIPSSETLALTSAKLPHEPQSLVFTSILHYYLPGHLLSSPIKVVASEELSSGGKDPITSLDVGGRGEDIRISRDLP